MCTEYFVVYLSVHALFCISLILVIGCVFCLHTADFELHPPILPASGAGASSSSRGSAKRKINIVRRVGPGGSSQPPGAQGGRRGGQKFKPKAQK